MDAARRVVLVDGGLGLALVLNWLLLSAPGEMTQGWWLTALGAVCMVAITYSDEHLTPDWPAVRRYAAAAVVVVGLAALWIGLALVVPQSAAVVGRAMAGGLGLGLLGYRLVFGVVYPVPERRLSTADERAV